MFRFLNRAPLAHGGTEFAGIRPPADTSTFPPHLFQPRGGRALFFTDTIATAGVGIYAPTGLQFVTPPGKVGVIRVLTPFISGMLASTDVTWMVRVNGVTANGLNGLKLVPRVADSLERIFDQWAIELGENSIVDVQIQQKDGGAYVVGMTLEGWFYSVASLG